MLREARPLHSGRYPPPPSPPPPPPPSPPPSPPLPPRRLMSGKRRVGRVCLATCGLLVAGPTSRGAWVAGRDTGTDGGSIFGVMFAAVPTLPRCWPSGRFGGA